MQLLVTPDQAREWLQTANIANPLDTGHILGFWRCMELGGFKASPPIKLTAKGEIADGRQRLIALVLANKSQHLDVEVV